MTVHRKEKTGFRIVFLRLRTIGAILMEEIITRIYGLVSAALSEAPTPTLGSICVIQEQAPLH
ncbi:hypothetical protein BLX24_03960 [Arsenicibacter rosenii]|uniref:Uncharacterized protein n=1 Tax=Arsenicibacter rosenii TaxID=1750698 RepID=A0A1S2VSG7_9BACT|nr:hypothetical protein BLX24_03960 [Arsenicibacter rosenii]